MALDKVTRFAVSNADGRVTLTPHLADRSIISRPEKPFVRPVAVPGSAPAEMAVTAAGSGHAALPFDLLLGHRQLGVAEALHHGGVGMAVEAVPTSAPREVPAAEEEQEEELGSEEQNTSGSAEQTAEKAEPAAYRFLPAPAVASRITARISSASTGWGR